MSSLSSVLSSGCTQHPSREQPFHHWLQGSHSSRALQSIWSCNSLPLPPPTFASASACPLTFLGSHPRLWKALCSVQCIPLKCAYAASSSQVYREVATLKSTNLTLKPAPLFLTAVHTARRTAAISGSGTGVSSIGIHLLFVVWFLQRDSCWAAPFPWLVTCSVLLSSYCPLSLWRVHPTGSRA